MHTYIQTHLFQNVVLFRPHKFKRLPTLKVPNARGTILNLSEFIVISSVDVGGISGHIWTLSPNSSVEMDSEAGQWQSIYLRSRCKSSAEWESTRSTSFNVFKWIIPNILTKSIVFLTAPINSLMLLPCWCGAKCGAGCGGVMQCPMHCPLDLLRPGHCTILLQAQPNLADEFFRSQYLFFDVTALALVSKLCERQEKHHGLRNCCKLCLEFALLTACSKAGTVHKESQWTWLTCVFPHHASAFASALKLQTRRRLCCLFRMPQVVTMYSEVFHAITSGRVRVQAAWVKSTLYIPVSYSQNMNLLECIGTHALFTCLHLWGHACLGLGHQEWRRSVSNA